MQDGSIELGAASNGSSSSLASSNVSEASTVDSIAFIGQSKHVQTPLLNRYAAEKKIFAENTSLATPTSEYCSIDAITASNSADATARHHMAQGNASNRPLSLPSLHFLVPTSVAPPSPVSATASAMRTVATAEIISPEVSAALSAGPNLQPTPPCSQSSPPHRPSTPVIAAPAVPQVTATLQCYGQPNITSASIDSSSASNAESPASPNRQYPQPKLVSPSMHPLSDVLPPLPPDEHVPFPSTIHKVRAAKYATSLDQRGFIPVYEYTLNQQPVLWDRETGYIYWTGIWKAMGRDKGEIAKLVDSDVELERVIRKIRGGYLKIQGTWMPFDRARQLAISTCWFIRHDLSPLFGPDFPNQALPPTHPDFAKITVTPKRKNKGNQLILNKLRQDVAAGMYDNNWAVKAGLIPSDSKTNSASATNTTGNAATNATSTPIVVYEMDASESAETKTSERKLTAAQKRKSNEFDAQQYIPQQQSNRAANHVQQTRQSPRRQQESARKIARHMEVKVDDSDSELHEDVSIYQQFSPSRADDDLYEEYATDSYTPSPSSRHHNHKHDRQSHKRRKHHDESGSRRGGYTRHSSEEYYESEQYQDQHVSRERREHSHLHEKHARPVRHVTSPRRSAKGGHYIRRKSSPYERPAHYREMHDRYEHEEHSHNECEHRREYQHEYHRHDEQVEYEHQRHMHGHHVHAPECQHHGSEYRHHEQEYRFYAASAACCHGQMAAATEATTDASLSKNQLMEVIMATVTLLHLSQDNGARPFPQVCSVLPGAFAIEGQEVGLEVIVRALLHVDTDDALLL